MQVVGVLTLAVTSLSHHRSQRVEAWRYEVVVVVVVAVLVAVVVEGGVEAAGCHGLHC